MSAAIYDPAQEDNSVEMMTGRAQWTGIRSLQMTLDRIDDDGMAAVMIGMAEAGWLGDDDGAPSPEDRAKAEAKN